MKIQKILCALLVPAFFISVLSSCSQKAGKDNSASSDSFYSESGTVSATQSTGSALEQQISSSNTSSSDSAEYPPRPQYTDTTSYLESMGARFFGRCYYSASDGFTYFNWSNSGFEFLTNGGKAEAYFKSDSYTLTGKAYIKVYVNDEEYKKIDIDKEGVYTLFEGLSGTNNVKVVKITEFRDNTLGVKDLNIIGGSVTGLPPEKTRRIEVIGDSITCGFSILGNNAVNNNFVTYEEDSTLTWNSILAEYFGAMQYTVAFSGLGIVIGTGKSEDLIIENTYNNICSVDKVKNANSEAWYFSDYTPDLVIINLGTNDAGTGISKETVESGVKKLLTQVRSKYPHAAIVWCYGMMTDDYWLNIKSGVEESGISDCYFVKLPRQSKGKDGNPGAAGHPNLKTNRRAADTLIPFIEELMHW